MRFTNQRFKQSIILLWALWWTIAAWTDIVGALAHLGILKATWAPDLNYPFLVQSLSLYEPHVLIPPILLIGIIAWAVISAGTFWWSVLGFRRPRTVWFHRAEIAFIVSMLLWFVFFLADQFVMKFDLEENHMVQGGFELLCYLCLYGLPEKDNQSDGKNRRLAEK